MASFRRGLRPGTEHSCQQGDRPRPGAEHGPQQGDRPQALSLPSRGRGRPSWAVTSGGVVSACSRAQARTGWAAASPASGLSRRGQWACGMLGPGQRTADGGLRRVWLPPPHVGLEVPPGTTGQAPPLGSGVGICEGLHCMLCENVHRLTCLITGTVCSGLCSPHFNLSTCVLATALI